MLLHAMDFWPPLLFRADWWVKHTGHCQDPEAIASILGFMGVCQLQRTHGSTPLIFSIQLLITVKGPLHISLMGHTANCVSGHAHKQTNRTYTQAKMHCTSYFEMVYRIIITANMSPCVGGSKVLPRTEKRQNTYTKCYINFHVLYQFLRVLY